MSTQEIIAALKEAKRKCNDVIITHLCDEGVTARDKLYNSGIYKNRFNGESYTTWNYNNESVNVIFKNVDFCGNKYIRTHTVRLKNITKIEIIKTNENRID